MQYVTENEPYDLEKMATMMADYNGWADESEEEREALDQLEMRLAAARKHRRLLRLRRLLVRATAREILARPTAGA
jgi:hypothetical protein